MYSRNGKSLRQTNETMGLTETEITVITDDGKRKTIRCHLSSTRISPDIVSAELHLYDIRHRQGDWLQPEAIEKTVKVNHMASIITRSPIDLGEKGSLRIISIRDWWK